MYVLNRLVGSRKTEDASRIFVHVLVCLAALRVALEPSFSITDLPGGVATGYVWSFLAILGSAGAITGIVTGSLQTLRASLTLEFVVLLTYTVSSIGRTWDDTSEANLYPIQVLALALSFSVFATLVQISGRIERRKEGRPPREFDGVLERIRQSLPSGEEKRE